VRATCWREDPASHYEVSSMHLILLTLSIRMPTNPTRPKVTPRDRPFWREIQTQSTRSSESYFMLGFHNLSGTFADDDTGSHRAAGCDLRSCCALTLESDMSDQGVREYSEIRAPPFPSLMRPL
jgi:hypothetical protein